MPASPSRNVMFDRHAAVDRNAGSYMNRSGSSSRSAELGNTPSVMGTVTVLPVRSSVIVMVSGTLFPSRHVCGGFLPTPNVTAAGAERSSPVQAINIERSAWLVAVLPGHDLLPLVLEGGERVGEHPAGLRGLDHGVDVAAVRGDVGVEQPLAVVSLERRSL